jgi:four helix bundle protein
MTGKGDTVGRAEKFEDVIAWQKARVLTRAVYEATQRGTFARDWGLTSQMQRAAVSVMSNIAEGFERGTPKEYLYFLSVAKASCAEVRSHLYVALDIGYIDQPTFVALLERSDEIARMLSGLRTAIQRAQAG